MRIEYDETNYTVQPCPFCGSAPRIRTVEHCFYIECAKVECGNEFRQAFARPLDAVFFWNQRYTYPPSE